jgi:hypothetical protein
MVVIVKEIDTDKRNVVIIQQQLKHGTDEYIDVEEGERVINYDQSIEKELEDAFDNEDIIRIVVADGIIKEVRKE